MAVKTIDSDSVEQALYATNHPVLEELIPYEPKHSSTPSAGMITSPPSWSGTRRASLPGS